MARALLDVSLQEPLNRFAKALTVPRSLLALHPRRQGYSGDAAALAPAITLGVISAFEGFVEEFIAVGAYSQGLGLAHVAKAIGGLNNPDLARFELLAVGQLGVPREAIGIDFVVDYWQSVPGSTWWQVDSLDWEESKNLAESWMQVRHLLAHGLTSGWRAEVWPDPLKSNVLPARAALRETPTGKHSLVIHGAINCARIYVEASRHLSTVAANHLNVSVDSSILPEFPLYKDEVDERAQLVIGVDLSGDELVDEGKEPDRDG